MPDSALSPHVAVVDDEEPIRKALERLLRAFGVYAETFPSGQAFLDSLGTPPRPDCLILDLHMPGMTGLHVLRQLQESGVPIPTIVITAYDEPETRTDCLAAGAAAYLRKPLDDSVLLETIKATVRDHGGKIGNSK